MTSTKLVIHSIQRYGVSGCMQRILQLASKIMHRLPYIQERHIWYRLNLADRPPRIALEHGMELIQGGLKELPLIARFKNIGMYEAERRLLHGADLWLVIDGPQVVFASWLFRRHTPMLAAQGGWLELPAETACLEDLVVIQEYRGRGIAAVALMNIAEMLVRQGVTTMIAKVEKHNLASCRTMEKAGFREIATMDMERTWLKLHVKIAAVHQDDFASYLAQHLDC